MSDEADPEGTSAPKRKRAPRKATAQYLENAAAHYLGRFATSKAHLREVMMQKVRRSHQHHGTELSEGAGFIDAVIIKFEGLGYLDDAAYAAMRARALHARGTPVRGIRFKLQQKGVAEDDIDAALLHLEQETRAPDLDLAAAVRLARRRRIGPYRSDDRDVRRERAEKDLATLARAGFSYDVARQVIDAADVDELELAAAGD